MPMKIGRFAQGPARAAPGSDGDGIGIGIGEGDRRDRLNYYKETLVSCRCLVAQ
jgi:hypothetical protein